MNESKARVQIPTNIENAIRRDARPSAITRLVITAINYGRFHA
jgi:hypothetical protein